MPGLIQWPYDLVHFELKCRQLIDLVHFELNAVNGLHSPYYLMHFELEGIQLQDGGQMSTTCRSWVSADSARPIESLKI